MKSIVPKSREFIMQNMRSTTSLFFVIVIISVLNACKSDRKNDRSWSVYKADPGSTSYSPLNQINTLNVSELKIAWTFRVADQKPGARPVASQCNPIIVDDVMYAVSAKSWAYALNAATGEQLWSFDPFDGAEGGGPSRGVTYW